jgi:hypothetical protein
MGISRLSALIIQSRGDEVRPEVLGQSTENDKWAGALSLYKGMEFDYHIVTTSPVHDTEEEVVPRMQELLDEIREMEL